MFSWSADWISCYWLYWYYMLNFIDSISTDQIHYYWLYWYHMLNFIDLLPSTPPSVISLVSSQSTDWIGYYRLYNKLYRLLPSRPLCVLGLVLSWSTNLIRYYRIYQYCMLNSKDLLPYLQCIWPKMRLPDPSLVYEVNHLDIPSISADRKLLIAEEDIL